MQIDLQHHIKMLGMAVCICYPDAETEGFLQLPSQPVWPCRMLGKKQVSMILPSFESFDPQYHPTRKMCPVVQ